MSLFKPVDKLPTHWRWQWRIMKVAVFGFIPVILAAVSVVQLTRGANFLDVGAQAVIVMGAAIIFLFIMRVGLDLRESLADIFVLMKGRK